METPSSCRRQALRQGADSNKVQVRKEIALSKYYSIAKRLLDSFTAAFDDRSLDEAYIYGVRFVSLCVESIPQHPSYRHRSYAMQHKEIGDKCKHVLECLEIVRQRMDAEEILREQQRQLELKEEVERQRVEEAKQEERRRQQMELNERQEATKTQMSALAKLSAMQRDLNQPTTKKDVSSTETKESVLMIDGNRPKKTGLIRAQVNFGGAADDSSSSMIEPLEPSVDDESTKDTAKSSSLMSSAITRMTSMVSRAPKRKETAEKSSEGTKQLVPAQVMDPKPTLSTSQADKSVRKEVKKETTRVEKKEALHPVHVPEKKKKKETSKETIAISSERNTYTQTAKFGAKAKPKMAKKASAAPSEKKKKNTSEKKTIDSTGKKNVPIEADKSAVKPEPSKVRSTSKAKTPDSQKQESKLPAKQNDKLVIHASAPRKNKVVQAAKANVAPSVEASSMDVDKVQEDATLGKNSEEDYKEPVIQRQRRPEEDTITLLETSITAQLKRIEEIEQKLIPKLLEQARKEHQIAKTPKISKQERILHKRKAIHCVSQKRKWEKLAETTKIAVFQMETQIFRLENAMEDQQVQEAIAEAKSTIQTMGNRVGVSDLQGFSDAVGAGDLVKTGVDGEEDELMMEELESWIGSDPAEETLNEDDLSILSLPNIPQNDLVLSPSSVRSKDKVSNKKLLVPAAM